MIFGMELHTAMLQWEMDLLEIKVLSFFADSLPVSLLQTPSCHF